MLQSLVPHIRVVSFALSVSAALTLGRAQSPVESTFVAGLQVPAATPATAVTQLFDVDVTSPTGIVVRQIDCNLNTLAGTTGTLGVYVTAPGGTATNNHLNPAVWTQVSTATRTHGGGRVAFTLQPPVYLPQGTMGFALHHVGCNPVYTNPTTASLPNTYATAEITLDMTAARVRVSDLVSAFGGTGAGYTPRHPNVALHYVNGPVYLEFAGTPNRGASPLPVQFTSWAASGNPGGILAYSWDFDNDGTPDSTVPDPLHTFTTCGDFTVSLTIVDAAGSTSVVKSNYVRTDVIVPDFTQVGVGGSAVLFTDVSSPAPTSWDWDFDNDGFSDASTPNPVWVFPSTCTEATVTLTVSRACQPPVTLTRKIAVGSAIETRFDGTLVTATGALSSGNFLDVSVTNPEGLSVCAMHVHSNLAAGNPVTVNVYQTEGSYVGKTGDAGPWRLVGTATPTSAGFGQRTFATFAPPIHLAAGNYGLLVELVGTSPVYVNAGSTAVYSNADITLTAGAAQGDPVLTATSALFTPRIWNGAMYYTTTSSDGTAGYGFIGAGCAGALGVPGNVAQSQPVIGQTANLVVDRLPLNIGLMVLGTGRLAPAFDLGLIGMPGCPLHATADVTATLLGAGGSATFPFPIPFSVGLVGVQVYTQALSLDLGLNPFGFAISDAAVMVVGQ